MEQDSNLRLAGGSGIAGGSRCENLRWKGLFLGDEAPQADSICWCLTTQIGIGPDGKVVDRYECNPARSCYRGL